MANFTSTANIPKKKIPKPIPEAIPMPTIAGYSPTPMAQTTAPPVVPSVNNAIKFYPIGSKYAVNYNGKDLTQQEYNAINAGNDTGGQITPQVQALRDANTQQTATLTQMKKTGQTAEQVQAEQVAQQQAIQNIGVLNPEQQALANSNTNMPLNAQEVASQVLNQGLSYGAAGGAAGLLAAPATAGASVPLLAAAGFAAGIIKGGFAAYGHQASERVGSVQTNIDKAQYNIRQAIILQNRGGDLQEGIQHYNDAVAQLLLAQRQLKEQSKSAYAWETGVAVKQIALETYLRNTLPIMNEKFAIAIQKPNPTYIDNGLDSSGTPL